jgi:hypothetical protein
MKASLCYRVAAILLVLFAIGHTLGFSQAPDPDWHVDAVYGAMHSDTFNVLGSIRSYWDFFMGAGLTVGIFYLFAAFLAWQLAGVTDEIGARLRLTGWAFALSFAAITVISWRYLFVIPVAFSAIITLCLAGAAWLSSRPLK